MEQTQSGRKFYPRPLECDNEINPELSLAQCLERRRVIATTISELEDNIASIQDQLTLAKQAKELTGEMVDVEWAGRATAALRGYHRVHREYLAALKVLNRHINGLRHRNEREAFIDVAQQLLEPKMFHRIWDQVRQGAPAAESAVIS
jgi:hypothetical protein